MSFGHARDKKQIDKRQEVFFNAAKHIFESGFYLDVTFVKLSREISIPGPAIYKYFKKTEGILMESLKIK